MSGQWEPGTVAMVTWRADGKDTTERAMRSSAGGWRGEGFNSWVGDSFVTDVRPLVLLDLDLAAHIGVDRLVGDLRSSGFYDIADQIEQQTRPPKPEEPQGLGAVVEDADGTRWTRVEPGANATSRNPWYPADSSEQPEEYADIDAVKVLSKGVQP